MTMKLRNCRNSAWGFGLQLSLIGMISGALSSEIGASEKLRIPWTESRVVGSPDPPLPYRVTRVYEKLPLFAPVYLKREPGTDRLFFVDHKGDWKEPGGLRLFQDRQDVDSSRALLHMDRMIYGFCFHPNYEVNGYLYLISNGPMQEANKQNRISRFTIDRTSDGTGGLSEDSELVVLEWDSNGHNGGDLAFGPDGFLYCPTGDGTSDSDTLETGQGLNDLLAVMLRLDVDHPSEGTNYSVPPDNPFINTPGARPEIWAYGFRNPWRIDYDHESNQLWLGQNGQDLWEQVYLIRKGENYGWSVQEGGHPFYLKRPVGPQPITPPVADHHHSESRSLTGGIVYRGAALPDLNGCFIYGDYSTGKIWGVRHDGDRVTFHRELADTTLQITGFAANTSGDLLVIDHAGGFYRIEVTAPSTPTVFPRRLSETGLFASVSDHKLLPSIIPYSVNVELWSDGAFKQRWLAVPGDEKIEYTSNRGWSFPNGSVLVKSFALEREAGHPGTRRWIETRLMVLQQKEWVGYSYRWNDEQTDAVLLDATGADVEFAVQDSAADGGVRRQIWHYPSRAECMVCHSRAVNYVLGLTENQMNREHDYGDVKANQLQMLADQGFFKDPLPKPVNQLSRLTDPFDPSVSLQTRATSYLHANCSNCHVEAGGGNAQFSTEIDAKPDQVRLVDVRPVHTSFEIPDARLVAPGDPERSLLLHRMQRRGHGQMPPIGTNQIDPAAIALIRQWILAMPARREEIKSLILPGEAFLVENRPAFILWPEESLRKTPQPWVFYAPTLAGYPDEHEKWMHQQFLAAGVAVAGIDVGEAYGSPASRKLFDAFYDLMTQTRGLAEKPCLLGRSRGGLWVTSWACDHPDRFAGLAGIYPVFDFRTYPGLEKAAPAYEMSSVDLERQLAQFNPIERMKVLANAKLPVFIIHGDEDTVVPLKENSATFAETYRKAGAAESVNLMVVKGQGHNFWEGFFRCQELIDFVIARAKAGAAK